MGSSWSGMGVELLGRSISVCRLINSALGLLLLLLLPYWLAAATGLGGGGQPLFWFVLARGPTIYRPVCAGRGAGRLDVICPFAMRFLPPVSSSRSRCGDAYVCLLQTGWYLRPHRTSPPEE